MEGYYYILYVYIYIYIYLYIISEGNLTDDDELELMDSEDLVGELQEDNWFEKELPKDSHMLKVQKEVKSAMQILGKEAICPKGSAHVTVTIKIEDILRYLHFFFY